MVLEARRLASAVSGIDAPLRFLGGVAVRLRRPDDKAALFDRHFEDLDVIAVGLSPKRISDITKTLDYSPERNFNAINGSRRLIFYREPDVKLEVFVNGFAMCHRIPMDRALLEPLTVPLAELLLTKLQIVNLTEKDLHDIYELLYGHEVSTSDDSSINAGRVALICSVDWGLWRTTTGNLEKSLRLLPSAGLPDDAQSTIETGIERLRSQINQAAKSLGWKVRARLGDRTQWYDDPDDI